MSPSMKNRSLTGVLLGTMFCLLAQGGLAELVTKSQVKSAEEAWVERQFEPSHRALNPRPDLQPRDGRDDWQPMIDAVWGPGLPGSVQLDIFMNWVNTLDAEFACFVNHDVDLVNLYTPYLPDVTAGVSRGRFQAIMSRICMALQNGHTVFQDFWVTTTNPERGVPLLVGLVTGPFAHLGACLTLGDEGAFVYEVISDHPLGLELGDVIFRYDGRPWSELCQELLDAELPVARGYWLTSDESYDYGWATAVGNNWHLFDTIDI
jgi:hypothetical protein